ncbi:MAG: glycosyltransferase family 9 protein [Spirochaetia bacterium]|nr:glycosyltransferase family 9 protein [Spirochaetia bacterium]
MVANNNIKRIIISRTDAIGDVILTLPICGIIKNKFPDAKIIYLGRTYTESVIKCCEYVDEFFNADIILEMEEGDAIAELKNKNANYFIHVFPNKKLASFAKKAGIKNRVGTTNRLFHWGKVNNLIWLSRKKSSLHESQLNCKLLRPLGIKNIPAIEELAEFTGFSKLPLLEKKYQSLADQSKKTLVLHPKSSGSAREWSLENYKSLIDIIPANRFNVFISGTNKERVSLTDWIKTLPSHVHDITGKFDLEQFIAFISRADYLVAASTGPLHIASACGIGAIGLYPPIKPMHPGRWKPIGQNARYVCIDKSCHTCQKKNQNCTCINEISPAQVAALIL